jgi:hypothetical protein
VCIAHINTAKLTVIFLVFLKGINICIKAGATKADSSIEVSGSSRHVITVDEQHQAFKIGDAELKRAAKKYFGKKPDDVFVHGPTPWNDLFKTNDWKEVTVVLVPTEAKILSVSSQAVVLATREFENKTSNSGNVSGELSESLKCSFASRWSTKKKTIGDR